MAMCKVKCALDTCFSTFLCETVECGPPGEHCSMWGPVFQTTGVVLGAAGNGSTKTGKTKGPRKTGTAARAVGYGEWTPPLYAPSHFFAIPMPECKKTV